MTVSPFSSVTMRRLIPRALIVLLVFGLTCGLWARLGGGGGYSGGGGGAGSGDPGTDDGGSGGSGIIILRMLTANYTGTISGSPGVSTSGDDTILQFTGDGSYTA